MKAIFLSASVPEIGRGAYHETANPFLIQCAVRELVMAVIRNRKIVWGGHPAITPMIWTICESLNVDYSQQVILYQSQFFKDRYPEENHRFKNVNFVEALNGDREASLSRMREEMLSRKDLEAAVFIGGMDGVEVEHEIFTRMQPHGKLLPIAATGGAALLLAERLGSPIQKNNVDFAHLFHTEFPNPTH